MTLKTGTDKFSVKHDGYGLSDEYGSHERTLNNRELQVHKEHGLCTFSGDVIM